MFLEMPLAGDMLVNGGGASQIGSGELQNLSSHERRRRETPEINHILMIRFTKTNNLDVSNFETII
jgi:hypothetical protein